MGSHFGNGNDEQCGCLDECLSIWALGASVIIADDSVIAFISYNPQSSFKEATATSSVTWSTQNTMLSSSLSQATDCYSTMQRRHMMTRVHLFCNMKGKCS